MKKYKSKGQVISMDLMISLVVISILFLFMINYYQKIEDDFYDDVKFQDMQIYGHAITQILLKTPGIPSNWENDASNVNMTGIVDIENRVVDDKLNAFIGLDYDFTRDLWNLEEDFLMEIFYQNNSVEVSYGATSARNKKAVAIQRVVLYQNEKRKFKLTIWE